MYKNIILPLFVHGIPLQPIIKVSLVIGVGSSNGMPCSFRVMRFLHNPILNILITLLKLINVLKRKPIISELLII